MEYRETCKNFVDTVMEHLPELQQKLKVHLVLHLVDDMIDFGPTSAFNTERYLKQRNNCSINVGAKHLIP